jgi:hypothetical protein
MNLKELLPDMCSCAECGWSGKVFDCISDTSQDSWENSTLSTTYFCPHCEDGGRVDDFQYSDETH